MTAVKKKKRRLHFWGVGLLVAAFVLLFVKSTELREILIALAAVFAVFIAAFSIDETRRLRKDSLDRESRDRKERLLNEIIEWAMSISTCGIDVDIDFWVQLVSGGRDEDESEGKDENSERIQALERRHRAYLLFAVLAISKKSEYMCTITRKIGRDLYEATKEVEANLDKQVALLRKGLTDKVTTTQIGIHMQGLGESAGKVIKEAVKIKTQNAATTCA